jgi:ABC-type multidrug transport system fused ATPase/permease subunit
VLVPAAFGPFVWLAIGYVGLTLAAGAVQFLDEVVSTWAGERFSLAVRTDVFAHPHRVPLVGLERRPLGDLISRLTGDAAAIEGFVLSGLTDALSYALQLRVFTGVLVYLDWRLALVALVVAPLFGFLARWFSSRIREASREKRRRTGALTAVAEESLANAMLVRAYRAEQRELDRFCTEGLACLAAQLRATRLRAVFSPAVDLVETVGALVVIGFGVWELSRGRLSLGGLLVFLAYVTQLYGPIRGLSRLATSAHAAAAGAERIAELLRERPEVEERPGALALGRARGVVEIDRVSCTYPGANRPALADLTLRIAPGEMVGLVGPSGAGKSTLVRLLLWLCDPDTGAVRLDG